MGSEKGPDEIFCRSCGEPIKKRAEICPNCGVANEYTDSQQSGQQSQQATTISSKQHGQSRSQSSPNTASSSVEPTTHDPSNHTTTVSDQWHYGVVASVVLWLIGFTMPEGSSIAGLFFLTAWILMPLSFYYDREWVRATTNWDPEFKMWAILFVIPGVNIAAGAVYLFRRFNKSQVSPPDAPFSTNEESDAALAQLRERYSKGELTDEEFEQKVERLVGTETEETAQTHLEPKKSDQSDHD